MSQIDSRAGQSAGNELVLNNQDNLHMMFQASLKRFAEYNKLELIYDDKAVKNLILGVGKEIRRNYPNIPGTSGVKWAGHLCSAIHHQRPILMKDMHRNTSPQSEFSLNAEFAFIFAIEIIQKSYLGKINHNKEIEHTKSVVFETRSAFDELIRSTLITHFYALSNSGSKINPMILAMFFEAFLEGRYPDVIKEGSNW